MAERAATLYPAPLPFGKENRIEALTTLDLPLDQIVVDETYRPPAAGLRDSLRRHGLLRPIEVRAREGAGYELVDGSRRVACARELGWPAIAAVVEGRAAGGLPRDLKALLLNTQRRNLQQLYIARHCRRLLAETGMRQAELARELGLSSTALSAMLRVLDCPDLTGPLTRGELEFGAAKALAVLPAADQSRLLEELSESARRAGKFPPVREVEERVRRCQGHAPAAEISAEGLAAVIEALRAAGAPVEIKTARGPRSRVRVALTLSEADQLRLAPLLSAGGAGPEPPGGEGRLSSPRGDGPS